MFSWVEEKHLDVPEGEGSRGFVMFAQQGIGAFICKLTVGLISRPELLKINHYKAPRDKLICILNCCKVTYGESFLFM